MQWALQPGSAAGHSAPVGGRGAAWQRLGGVTTPGPELCRGGVECRGQGFGFCVGSGGGPEQSAGRGVTLWACI